MTGSTCFDSCLASMARQSGLHAAHQMGIRGCSKRLHLAGRRSRATSSHHAVDHATSRACVAPSVAKPAGPRPVSDRANTGVDCPSMDDRRLCPGRLVPRANKRRSILP